MADPEFRLLLIEAFLKRAQTAADQLRALLFAFSAGAMAFVLNQPVTNGRLWSVAFLGLALITLTWSWDIQKAKALTRFNVLRDKGMQEYLSLEKSYETRKQNYLLDRAVYLFILIGCAIEFFARVG
ncbi:MAG: hypothetical protein Q8L54_06840 [Devosia sp.]|nr:hypothetical protein [Devosia sp.]